MPRTLTASVDSALSHARPTCAAGAVVHRSRPHAIDRLLHRGAIEKIDRVPPHQRRCRRRRTAGAMPGDHRTSSPTSRSSRWLPAKPAAPVTRIVAGMELCYRGTPPSAPLNGEKFPRPASVNDMKKRWSDGTELREPKLTVWYSNASPQHWAL